MIARARVELPAHVTAPFEVFVNGVPQRPGVDYERIGHALLFERELATEGKLGFWRWASMLLGVAGTYRKHDTVDIVYGSGSERHVETGLPFEPLA